MRIPLYQIDAFTSRVFGGNPAAVCPLEEWLDDATMQAIAAENNLAETAFFVGRGERRQLRWFTPACEIDLCGHATLASALVISELMEPGCREMKFDTRSGELAVTRNGDMYTLDFPALKTTRMEASEELVRALGDPPREVWRGARDTMVVYGSEDEVRSLAPDMAAVQRLDTFAVIVTAPGNDVDFVSRFFAPAAGIPEDPVTGSAHCTLIPYWAQVLGKTKLAARQISQRGGELWCELVGDRVRISGHGVLFAKGEIYIGEREISAVRGR
jgi:PhzF family phenazine biosynthesis protein